SCHGVSPAEAAGGAAGSVGAPAGEAGVVGIGFVASGAAGERFVEGDVGAAGAAGSVGVFIVGSFKDLRHAGSRHGDRVETGEAGDLQDRKGAAVLVIGFGR